PFLSIRLHLARISEGVRMHELEPRLIEVRVAAGLGDSSLVEVHARDVGGAPDDLRIERKSAGVTTKVENPRISRELRHTMAVVTLIAEKTRLVADGEIDFVTDAMLADFHGARRRGIGLVEPRWLDPFEAAEVVIHLYARELRSGELVQQ